MSDHQDALVVVAADEVASLLFHTFDKRQWLASTKDVSPDQSASLHGYSSQGQGLLLGEGAVSLVLERASKAKARGVTPLAVLSGYGMTADAALSAKRPL